LLSDSEKYKIKAIFIFIVEREELIRNNEITKNPKSRT